MSKNIQVTAAKRDGAGKGPARRIRVQNNIPAVIYGDHKAPVLITLEAKPLMVEYLKGHLFTSLCDLTVDGEKHLVITRDVQLDPVTDNIIHADFLRVSAKTVIKVNVPVHFTNQEANTLLKGGEAFLSVMHHDVELMCPANTIPESIEVDVTGLAMGDTVKLSDLKLPKGVKPAAKDAEAVSIASLHAPRVQEVETAAPVAAEGEAAEGEKKEEAK